MLPNLPNRSPLHLRQAHLCVKMKFRIVNAIIMLFIIFIKFKIANTITVILITKVSFSPQNKDTKTQVKIK